MSQPEAPRALICEDNRVNRMVARQVLRQAGFQTEEAENGEQAIALLAESRFDVVLMDIEMPGLSGLEAARAIRSGERPTLNLEVPIVAMTAYASEADRAACTEAGMDFYVAKPLDLAGFVATVREAISVGRRRRPESP